MHASIKPSMMLFLALFTLAGFGIVAILVAKDNIGYFDHGIISVVQGLENPFLTSVMKFFTFIGAGDSIKVLAVIAAIILFFVLKQRSELLLLLAAVTGSPIIWRTLKDIFQRARPDVHRLIEIDGYSFPSGHATNAIAFYGILAFLLWKHIPARSGRILLVALCSVIIFLIGLSRIYLGVHYPSDVIGGYLAGGFWLVIVVSIYHFIRKRLINKRSA